MCSVSPNLALRPNISFKRTASPPLNSSVRLHRGNIVNIKALLFSIVGVVVALFYALESFLSFQANGFTVPLIVKILICGIGVYFFLRNVKRIKKSGEGDSPADAA
jgi:hypothetical protein